MERHANYTLIGGVTIVGVILSFLFALWIARASFNAEYRNYDVVFQGPARGIGAGTEVRFNGIRVGEVRDLFMPRGQENSVVARIRIGSTWPVRLDSEARLEPIGLTGQNLIQISPGTQSSALLPEPRLGEAPPQIPAKQGAIDELLESSEDIARNAAEALQGARDILSQENAARFERILTNLEDVSKALAAERGAINNVAGAAQEISATARQFTATAKEIEGFSTDARTTLASLDTNVSTAIVSIQKAADSIDTAAKSVEGAAGAAAYDTLPELASASADLRRLTVTLDRVAGNLERSRTFNAIGEQKPLVKVDQ